MDDVLTREQVVELTDAVAASGGIATGIGTSRYGVQVIVEAAPHVDLLLSGHDLASLEKLATLLPGLN